MILWKMLIGVLVLATGYILFLFVCSLFVDPKREYEIHSDFYRWLLNTASSAALKLLRVKVHVDGLEKIPADTKNLLFVSNHRSNFDPIITWVVLKQWKPAFVSKASNFKIPIFGRFIRKCCFMAIDRENPRNALKTIQKASALLQKGEVSIGIYPEGTRSKNGVLLPFHNGVFKIAQKADAAIVVLWITGTEQIHKRVLLHRTDVHLSVLEMIPPEVVQRSRTDALGGQIKELMQGQAEKIGEIGNAYKDTCSELQRTAGR